VALASCGAAYAADTPQLLIATLKAPKLTGSGDEVLANYIARDLDEDGRVVPIVWGLTDPIFREAVYSGKLTHAPDQPTLEECLSTAQTLHAKYVLIFSSKIKGAYKIGTCELYFGGRVIWKDTEQMSVSQGATGIDSRSDSIAHTWCIKMQAEPLRALSPQPKSATRPVGPGDTPIKTIAPEVEPVPKPEATTKFDPAVISSQVQKLEQDGKLDAALTLVRDSIDEHPLEPSLRLLLVRVLEAQGNYRMAAEEAQRGSEMIPTSRDLRFAAVRDLLQAGETNAAKSALNEMLARGDQDSSTLLLEGQIALAASDLKQADTCLNRSIQTTPCPEAYYWRAVTRALLGGEDGVRQDAQLITKSPLTAEALDDSYPVAIKLLDGASTADFNSVSNVFGQASLKGVEMAEQIDEMVRRATARGAFLEAVPTPPEFKESHAKALLAQKLLSLSLIDLQDFVKTGNEDSITDGRINLGEAMRQSKAAEVAFAAETGTSRNATASIHPL
jgi:tetratricopeptide (TPR) repeat protein